ncbi:Transmembrane protein [Wickerhamomyces ciferrii]|uniref:Transmembrane protein n=1 Tax=Wickerhamomyces ciferrii (strain ATCC 14091 / BCRC 22168 / CBS 111 / JCM 3599 / NBRC 0793 / NRRL Y-1031 F-60-10) TaxID=1206466 RepID=K0KKU7_WICCF|nr:Transmembrane protein [Wickerhamomyces ciferrii]CCH41738.1 Transmembrane protein [Wickerhamomyces ciferrii]
MAGQSAKKQVAQNFKILKEIHTITWTSYAIFSFFNFYFKRPQSSKWFIITALPALGSLYLIEKFGRPIVDPQGKIIRLGQDLTEQGLTEYLFDIIYYTIILNFLTIVFNSTLVWWLYLAVPSFAAYKIYNVINAGRQLFGGGSKTGQQVDEYDNNGTKQGEQGKSKRQQKREARGDKPKMRYR